MESTSETNEGPSRTPPDEDIVHVDGRAIPFRTWEHELMLRAAAWVAMVQGAGVTYVAGARWLRFRALEEGWLLATGLGLIAIGWILVRSRAARRVLVAVGVAFLLLMATGGMWPSSGSVSARLDRIAPLVAGVGYAVCGPLLLWRRGLARDLLLVLSGAWLLVVGPNVLEELSNASILSTPPLTSWGSYYPAYGLRDLGAEKLLPIAACWLLPPAFVFLTMLSRAGRSVLVEGGTRSRLAPFVTLRQGPPTARGWASFLVFVLVFVGTALTLETLSDLVRELW